jgi:hypothetical protein
MGEININKRSKELPRREMSRFLILIIGWISISGFGIPNRMWELFATTQFQEKLDRSLGMYFYYPRFSPYLLTLQGKTIELEGFYIPLDLQNSRTLVLSKYPMAECFFCGGSGPESIALVHLKTAPGRKLKMDQIIRIKGVLKLNATDVEEMTFIISNAEFITN